MGNPKEKKIQQVGLTSNSLDEIDKLAGMVDKFNRSKDGLYVELEYMETPPGELNENTGRYRLLFTFAHREAQQAFWFGNF